MFWKKKLHNLWDFISCPCCEGVCSEAPVAPRAMGRIGFATKMSFSRRSPEPVLQAKLPSLCVPLAHTTAEALLAHSAALFAEYPFQELRLDALADPIACLPGLRAHVEAHPEGVFLVTCRRVASGGQFAGTPEAERSVLLAAAAAGCALVDLALESAEALGPDAFAPFRQAGTAVVLSWHDFAGTPDLDAVLQRMQPFAPDFAKVVPTASSLLDSLMLLRLLERDSYAPMPLVAMSMGEFGGITRVLGPRAGAAFTFAPATPAEATAPGQMAAPVLRDLYRTPTLTRASRLYGVAGSPIRSSLSPLMLNTAFRATATDATYLPLLTDSPAELFELARALPLSGISVTMPLKVNLHPFLDRVDPLAARIGAVNTVRRESDGTWSGFNTDAFGITAPVQDRLDLTQARILVLGAGGAARAAVFACADQGATVSILSRTFASAAELAGQSGATALRSEELGGQPRFDVLINATPAGMRHNPAQLPLPTDLLPNGQLPADLIFDLVYNPWETPLLKLAREQGRGVIHGVEMFLHQGARQFELWTGQPAPVEAMREVVLDFLE